MEFRTIAAVGPPQWFAELVSAEAERFVATHGDAVIRRSAASARFVSEALTVRVVSIYTDPWPLHGLSGPVTLVWAPRYPVPKEQQIREQVAIINALST